MKKKILVIAVILIIFTAAIVAKTAFQQDVQAAVLDQTMNVRELYDQLKSSGKPSIIVLYYKSDCCTNTEEYYNEYKRQAMQLLEANRNRVGTLFIDTTALTEEQSKDVIKIAKENNINTYPVVLLLNSKGELEKSVVGFFEFKNINKIIDKLVKS